MPILIAYSLLYIYPLVLHQDPASSDWLAAAYKRPYDPGNRLHVIARDYKLKNGTTVREVKECKWNEAVDTPGQPIILNIVIGLSIGGSVGMIIFAFAAFKTGVARRSRMAGGMGMGMGGGMPMGGGMMGGGY